METKTALITGITGQDGSFLAELLLKKGYDVYGIVRRLSHPTNYNISHIMDDINLIDGDLEDSMSIVNAINESKPDEIYNLGAQSFVGTSWKQAELTSNVNCIGALRIFEASRKVFDTTSEYCAKKYIKIYQASSSEMYGNVPPPQNEDTKMLPRSPYGVSKLFAHNLARVYRESYGMFVSCGICFNHESERRGPEFVSMKIANAVARIYLGSLNELKLGNLDARRDWGYAKDYVEAMYLMLQQEKPDDFVIATGNSHTVEDFVKLAFDEVGLDWREYVVTDKHLYRPAEIYDLRGDSSKAERILGWKPKTSFEDLVKIMVKSEIKRLENNDQSQS